MAALDFPVSGSATGGTITSYNSYNYHTFTSSSSFVVTGGLTVDYLIVGGGEAGGTNNFPGPGGAGGFVTYYTGVTFASGTYTITVGGGGSGIVGTGYNYGASGGTSSIVGGSINATASGGYGFGVFQTQSGYNNNGSSGTYSGGNGAGGGGAGGNSSGNNGGVGSTLGNTITSNVASGGGTVYGHLVSGTYYYGSGGGNYYSTTYANGGGGIGNNGSPTNGTANTGGGGGGGGTNLPVGSGGSGIVIIRYLGTGSTTYTPAAVLGTGGTITTNGNYTIHTFTSSGTLTIPTGGLTVDYLVVAGGGGGASGRGGGGGGGGLLTGTNLSLAAGSYSVTVGAGGNGGPVTSDGSNGTNSVFSSYTSIGGGGGGTFSSATGQTGGSGGGGAAGKTGAAGTSGQGNSGGSGTSASGYYGAGGGGGSGANGSNGDATIGGNGGVGSTTSLISTTLATSLSVGQVSGGSVYFSGGGGGGSFAPSTSSGGLGGGARGGVDNTQPPAATANTGGGGGGGGVATGNGAAGSNGGSGIVIVRYVTPVNTAGTFTYNGSIWQRSATTSGLTGPTGPTGNGVNDIPRITSVSPTGAIYVDAGGTVTITGSDFVSGCIINVNGQSATSVTFNSSTSITAVLPGQTAGTYHLYLTNPDGGTTVYPNAITYSGYRYFFGTATTVSGNYYASRVFTTNFTLQFRTYVTGTTVTDYSSVARNLYWGYEQIWISTDNTNWTELMDRAKYSAYGTDLVRTIYAYSYQSTDVQRQNTSWWQVTRSGTTVTCTLSVGSGYGSGSTKSQSYTVAASNTPVYIRYGNQPDGGNTGNNLSIVYDTQP